MSLTKEDLLAIENIFDKKVDVLAQGIGTLGNRMDSLEYKMDSLENRMDGLEHRMDGLEHDIKYIKVDLIENNILPRLSTIESCYTSTYDRYREGSEKFSNAIDDIAVMKMAIRKNSEDIQTLMLKQA
jgi:hypothetical protein